jgi:DNA invertase Pin-like site-specific DNA recombinase
VGAGNPGWMTCASLGPPQKKFLSEWKLSVTLLIMSNTLVGYARCSTDTQDLTAQRQRLRELGVEAQRIYLDHGLTGTTCARPGLDQALAAVRSGDTLVVTKLARLARSVPDAAAICDSLAARGIRLSLGGHVYDPTDPLGKMFFTIMVTVAEFEIDLMRLKTREGTVLARVKGSCAAGHPNSRQAANPTVPDIRQRRLLHHRPRS